jgi:large conductance mechanosensitive channel
VVGIATGFVLGAATIGVVKSLVDDIILPVISPFGGWKETTWTIGNAVIGWGNFLSQVLNFLLIAFIVFITVKKLLKR